MIHFISISIRENIRKGSEHAMKDHPLESYTNKAKSHLGLLSFVFVTHLSSLFVLIQPSIISFTSGMATLSKLPGFTPCTSKIRQAVKAKKLS